MHTSDVKQRLHMHSLPAIFFFIIENPTWFIHVILYTEILFTVTPEHLAGVFISFSVKK